MNTRLQVEHPVTEMITGLDLVAEQIRIAEGEPLGFSQEDVKLDGWAVEARVYAEDVPAGFLPAPGPLLRHRPPSGPGIRLDSGVEEGDVVPVYYDPMISKLVAWAPTRLEAIDRLDRALAEYEVAGVRTTIPFCRLVMQSDAFRSGNFDTGFVDTHFDAADLAPTETQTRDAALAAGLLALDAPSATPSAAGAPSRWVARRWA